jgi:hypothetical protein
MDIEPIHSHSSSGSSSSSLSSTSGSAAGSSAHVCIPSMANPSHSSSGHASKRKLSDVAGSEEAQLPQPSVAHRGDPSGSSSSGTTELRADVDECSGSSVEEKSGEESESGSIAAADSGSSSAIKKKKSKRQKRKAKLLSAEKQTIIAEARDAWNDLKTKHRECVKQAENCEAFDLMKDLNMRGETARDFRVGMNEAIRRFDVWHAEVIESGRRLNRILQTHPSILRSKRGLASKPPSGCGTFEEEFETF